MLSNSSSIFLVNQISHHMLNKVRIYDSHTVLCAQSQSQQPNPYKCPQLVAQLVRTRVRE